MSGVVSSYISSSQAKVSVGTLAQCHLGQTIKPLNNTNLTGTIGTFPPATLPLQISWCFCLNNSCEILFNALSWSSFSVLTVSSKWEDNCIVLLLCSHGPALCCRQINWPVQLSWRNNEQLQELSPYHYHYHYQYISLSLSLYHYHYTKVSCRRRQGRTLRGGRGGGLVSWGPRLARGDQELPVNLKPKMKVSVCKDIIGII